MFEDGQEIIPQWHERDENEVLIDRCREKHTSTTTNMDLWAIPDGPIRMIVEAINDHEASISLALTCKKWLTDSVLSKEIETREYELEQAHEHARESAAKRWQLEQDGALTGTGDDWSENEF